MLTDRVKIIHDQDSDFPGKQPFGRGFRMCIVKAILYIMEITFISSEGMQEFKRTMGRTTTSIKVNGANVPIREFLVRKEEGLTAEVQFKVKMSKEYEEGLVEALNELAQNPPELPS